MEHLEMVEKLVVKTGVTFEEAKGALEACQWDMLDAVVYLEKLGKVKAPSSPVYTTQFEKKEDYSSTSKDSGSKSFGDVMTKFFGWCGELIKKGNENFFEIYKNDDKFLSMPVTILVLLLLFAFWVVLPLIVVGLFFGFKYSFRGKVAEGINLNGAMNKASEVAENIKKEFENEKKDN